MKIPLIFYIFFRFRQISIQDMSKKLYGVITNFTKIGRVKAVRVSVYFILIYCLIWVQFDMIAQSNILGLVKIGAGMTVLFLWL